MINDEIDTYIRHGRLLNLKYGALFGKCSVGEGVFKTRGHFDSGELVVG